MNWRVLKTVCAAVVFSAWMTPVFSQNYYLVIGAFSTENENVREFTSYLPSSSLDTAYTVQANNNLLHLYVMKTSSKEVALENGIKLQEHLTAQRPAPVNPEQVIANAEIKNATSTDNTTAILASAIENEAASGSTGEGNASGAATPAKPRSQSFKFTLARTDGTQLPGEVHQVDFTTGRDLRSFSTGIYNELNAGPAEPVTLVCGVFGYKEVEKYIDFTNLANNDGVYRDEQGAWVIPYKLERLERGDVSVMYNVAFHKDAVMMTPQSKLDLDELYNLMISNANYVIKVHAHCNGKKSRNILTWGDEKNYFDVTGGVQVNASAKELTNLRAETIKSYLIGRGISADRIKTYGWGGTEMLVPADDANARLNDRIEIEILKD